jgi:DNA processing protein
MTDTDACTDCLGSALLLKLLGPYIERAGGRGGVDAVSTLLRLPDEELARRVAPEQAPRILARIAADRGDHELERIAAAGCRAVCVHSDRFPSALRDLDTPPRVLFGRGDLAAITEHPADRTVAIVGSRRATSYGRDVARTLASDLAGEGVLVISGLAFGIDACAHHGALDSGGATVAVLGCGPDTAYPAAHRQLWRRISEEGAVISELPPGSTPWRWTFPARNRIVAGLAGITVVVEAAPRSGTMITARLAREAGREVGAVPGPVTSRASAGANGLLAEGATVIRGAAEVLGALGRVTRT